MRRFACFAASVTIALGCSSSQPEAPSGAALDAGRPAPKPLPELGSAALATDARLAAKHAIDATAALDPRKVDQMQKLLADGWGDIVTLAGEPLVAATLDGSAPPSPGPKAKMLLRFVHLADTQLADDESPARLAAFDSVGLADGAFRPQEGHQCWILNAAVRTINAVHAKLPLSFVLLGGDNADNAQTNELDWFRAILDGAASVECDSGHDDDPVPGPDNDPKDPFVAEGLKMPWRWVTGNHDVEKQGTLPLKTNLGEPVGTLSIGGTRDWSLPGAPVVKGDVVIADARRAYADRDAMLKAIAGDQDGHGIDAKTMAYGKAYYAFDVQGTPLRIVVMDTAAETGGADGVVHQADVDTFLKPALDQAKSAGKWVILTSHHVSRSLSDGSDFGGTKQADALTTAQFQALVGGYPNVLVHLAGHSHVHRVLAAKPPGGNAYWELQTASLADFPHQMRVVEVWDQDDGYVSIRGVALDYSTGSDPVAADGRSRGVADFTSGWGKDGRGALGDRNVELWVKKP